MHTQRGTSLILKLVIIVLVTLASPFLVHGILETLEPTGSLVVNGVQLERCPHSIVAFFSDGVKAQKTLCEGKNAARLMFAEIDARQKAEVKQREYSNTEESKWLAQFNEKKKQEQQEEEQKREKVYITWSLAGC